MASGILVTNTLGFVFPNTAAQPSVPEMVGFVKGLAGITGAMDTVYKNAEDKMVYIKYKSEEAMNDALARNPKKMPFNYANGTRVEVEMSIAGSNLQYVRVFDLPPELSDQDLSLVLMRYGKVKRCVREKFPPEYQLDLFTGVRGLYMDVEHEIPSTLYFHNRRGKVYYNGNKLKCFACGQEGHQKIDCGKRKKKSTPAQAHSEQKKNNTFAAVVAETRNLDEQTVGLEIEVLGETEKEADEENGVIDDQTMDDELGNQGQQNTRAAQLLTPVVRHYQPRVKQQTGNWTENVKLHTHMVKQQQKQQKHAGEISPPRKTLRPSSPQAGAK